MSYSAIKLTCDKFSFSHFPEASELFGIFTSTILSCKTILHVRIVSYIYFTIENYSCSQIYMIYHLKGFLIDNGGKLIPPTPPKSLCSFKRGAAGNTYCQMPKVKYSLALLKMQKFCKKSPSSFQKITYPRSLFSSLFNYVISFEICPILVSLQPSNLKSSKIYQLYFKRSYLPFGQS